MRHNILSDKSYSNLGICTFIQYIINGILGYLKQQTFFNASHEIFINTGLLQKPIYRIPLFSGSLNFSYSTEMKQIFLMSLLNVSVMCIRDRF